MTPSSGAGACHARPLGAPQLSSGVGRPRTLCARDRVDHRRSHGAGFWLDYDVPLNGAFSDLTARFEFHWRAPQTLAVQLHDLHVT